ncbi:MAG: Crp/Fnr family transcriptional regulator [Cellulosilyticaceae bacterium]
MTLEQLTKQVPGLSDYLEHMPESVRAHAVVRHLPPGMVVHQKDFELKYFAIVCTGEHRVINEFENGNIFMIEKNEPIDFIGEVTILAGQTATSVTIETLTPCTIIQMPREDFEHWITVDNQFLRLVSQKVALKLYRSSYNRGAKLFYPSIFFLMEYIVQYGKTQGIQKDGQFVIQKTREAMTEEIGMTIKTLNRSVKKLKDDGLVGIERGKMTVSYEQYKQMRKAMHRTKTSL